jgi:hypothetical protein
VLFLEVSDTWAIDKLEKRGKDNTDNVDRKEDRGEGIKKRVEWYEENVLPAIQFFKNNPYYKFISINGEQRIDLSFGRLQFFLDIFSEGFFFQLLYQFQYPKYNSCGHPYHGGSWPLMYNNES